MTSPTAYIFDSHICDLPTSPPYINTPKMAITNMRKRAQKKPEPAPLMPEDLAALNQLEKDKKARAARQKQKQEKLHIVPGPVSLDWVLNPDSADFLDAIDKITQMQWKDIPEKMNSREKADVYSYRSTLPPLVMVTHLYAVFLNDSTFVEREIRQSCQSQVIRRLMVNVVDGGELLIKAEDFYRILKEWATTEETARVFEMFEDLLQEMPEAQTLTIYDLESRPQLAEKRSIILSAGFLTLLPGQSDTFNISIPNVGTYLKLVANSRKWVQRNLAKSAWKEMLESKLAERWESNKSHWKDFRGANLEWTLSDCYGGGWCEAFTTPVGRGWKLTGKR